MQSPPPSDPALLARLTSLEALLASEAEAADGEDAPWAGGVDVGRERILARVASGPVATVMAEGYGFGQGHVEAEAGSDGPRHLCNLEGVGES